MSQKSYFRRVDFHRFKAFSDYRVDLRSFNILVGPNNAGKSTIIAAFRILAAAMRKASTRRAEIVRGPSGTTRGYEVDLRPLSVAEENIFYNYKDDDPAFITFHLSTGYRLTLYFPEQGTCHLIADADGRAIDSPATFKANFNCQIGFVPILGPVEHNEPLYEKEAARLALFNYRAARNFRNIWFHYPEHFERFREVVAETWPGMDVEPPEMEKVGSTVFLYMYCPENRVTREIFWSGFGFQVWCQMLTHLIQSQGKSLFLIDEPDIYLHSELQRQLLELLRNLGPDVIIATHSTEIISEANPDEIVVVDKKKQRSRRIKNPTSIEGVFSLLGSNLNPILTQLAKTRRALFVEGKDFQILGRFSRRLGLLRVGNRSDFAVVPVDGFNPEKMRNLKAGMEATLGTKVLAALVLDRDYRSDAECLRVAKDSERGTFFVHVHDRKEIENYLLNPAAIDRAAELRIAERGRRPGAPLFKPPWAIDRLQEFAEGQKNYVASQLLGHARLFERTNSPGRHETEISMDVLDDFERKWAETDGRLGMLPGKEALSFVNRRLQEEFGVSLTPAAIIEAMSVSEIPAAIKTLVAAIGEFARSPSDEEARQEATDDV